MLEDTSPAKGAAGSVVDVPVARGVLIRSLGDLCEQRGDVRADVVWCPEMHSRY